MNQYTKNEEIRSNSPLCRGEKLTALILSWGSGRALYLFALCALVLWGCTGCTSVPQTTTCVTQIATIDSLLTGVYDGTTELGELRKFGNFGIGTLDRLDGELLFLDNTFYQVPASGQVQIPSDKTTTPFASIATFYPQFTTNVEANLDYQQLCKELDTLFPNQNLPVAIYIKGSFSSVCTRSVPAQSKPYPPLVEVTKTQPEFELGRTTGEIVGYRLPGYVKGINVPGYHLHFITTNRKQGGHLLTLQMEEGEIQGCYLEEVRILLPGDSEAFRNADLNKDRSQELHQAESAH